MIDTHPSPESTLTPETRAAALRVALADVADRLPNPVPFRLCGAKRRDDEALEFDAVTPFEAASDPERLFGPYALLESDCAAIVAPASVTTISCESGEATKSAQALAALRRLYPTGFLGLFDADAGWRYSVITHEPAEAASFAAPGLSFRVTGSQAGGIVLAGHTSRGFLRTFVAAAAQRFLPGNVSAAAFASALRDAGLGVCAPFPESSGLTQAHAYFCAAPGLAAFDKALRRAKFVAQADPAKGVYVLQQIATEHLARRLAEPRDDAFCAVFAEELARERIEEVLSEMR